MKPWQASENFWAKILSGQRQPGSGNKSGAPGDVRTQEIRFAFEDTCLLESKMTEKKSLVIHEGWLKKISNEALHLGRTPLLGLQIGDERWIALPAWAIGRRACVGDG